MKSNSGARATILQYKVPRTTWSEFSGLELSVRDGSALKEWRHVIRFYRSGEVYEELPDELYERLTNPALSFIQGPLSRDKEYERNKDDPSWPQPLDGVVSQLCLRSQLLSNKFNQSLVKVIYVEPGGDPAGF